MRYIANAFSVNMIGTFPVDIHIDEIDVDQAASYAEDATSIVGHTDTANVFSSTLGVPVTCNRTTVAVRIGDEVIVGQYRGPRLPEGARVLPAGATIQWFSVQVGWNSSQLK